MRPWFFTSSHASPASTCRSSHLCSCDAESHHTRPACPVRWFAMHPPPPPQGWFDTVYCDDSTRVAQDIRGDTLVVVRDGPPRIFK